MSEPRDIQRVWLTLIAAYPTHADRSSAEDQARTLRLYQKMLADIPRDVLEAAALQHIASSKWFPTVAELRDRAGSIVLRDLPTAMEGWGEVTAAMADPRFYRYADGFHEYPRFTPITQRVVDAMGWGNLCGSEDGTADRARFIQAYDIMARRQNEEAQLLPQVRELAAKLRAGAPKGLPAPKEEANGQDKS